MSVLSPPRRRWLLASAVVVCGVTVAVAVTFGKAFFNADPAPTTRTASRVPPRDPRQRPIALAQAKHLTVWWDNVPAEVRSRSLPAATDSNIHPTDYVGPQACRTCHQKNYESWSKHPHRWMNALADDNTVVGDFSGAAISYRGGTATFERKGGDYRMRLERGNVRRVYRVTQTIGSRFFQYYVGRQIEGPESSEHLFFQKDHVLPFGYWLDPKEWVPTVHIGPELPDEERPDPFEPPAQGRHFAEYAVSCNYCHTTFPLGDLLGRRPQQAAEHAPRTMHWSVRPYLEAARPTEVPAMLKQFGAAAAKQNPMADWDAEHYAVAFGVTCEACHLGGREHVASKGQTLPKFFPHSPHLLVEGTAPPETGRTHDNLNWACGRCHIGGRPTFAAGMSTWNSVEYSDAMRGSCYSQLQCVDCHNPHQPIGRAWTASADHDDAVCLKCHAKLKPDAERRAHTHHPAGSDGARCLNCHMPRINEGLQDLVRTHMIYSPTRADMIEANHPNACNICHTDRPIDWTLARLKEWYGRSYDEGRIAASYGMRTQPVARGWLASSDPAVRLVAADALTRRRDKSAVPQLIDALDDGYLVNRQFAARGLERMLNIRLADFGYRFYLTRTERQRPLTALRMQQLGTK